jgi:outer membrane receptor protein involved in Fe transport
MAVVVCGPLHAAEQPNDSARQSKKPSADAERNKPTAPAEAVQPIIVTGSRIPRVNLTAISPVRVVDSREVKLEGVVLTENLLNDLPQVTPDQGVFQSGAATGTATVNLRDLGASRTLVLINGRRFMPGDPRDPAADINAIPSSLISRVEVLTGGASSVYGSDAVSGVVNFILDTHIRGLRIDGQSSVYQHDNRNGSGLRDLLIAAGDRFPKGNTVDGGVRDINGAWGSSFLDGRGHVAVYAGYRHIDPVTEDARDFSACTPTVDVPGDPLVCGGSIVSGEGNFLTAFGLFHLEPDQSFAPGPTFFNFAPVNYFQRPGTRYTTGGFADVEFSPAFDPYLEAMFMSDRSLAQIAPSGDFADTTSINCDNPLLSPQELSLLCAPGNLVTDDNGNPIAFSDPVTGAKFFRGNLFLLRRNVEGGPRQDDLRHKNLRLLSGIKGDLGHGITYDASYLMGHVRMVDVHTNDVLTSRLERALDVVIDPATGQPVCRSVLTGEDPECLPWDVFALNGVSPEAAASLTVPARLAGTVKQQVATAFVTVDLDSWRIGSPWATEPPSINLGVEYRKDSLSLQPDEHFQAADLAGLGQPVLPFDGSTSVKELFGETRIPLVTGHLIDNLTFEGGYRQSWHSDGDHRFATNSSKLGLELTPVRGLRFRATDQRAVRAPNVQELFAPIFTSEIDSDPCAGPAPKATQAQCAFTGVTAAQFGHVPQNPFENVEGDHSIVGGNPDLAPEVARTRSIGAVLEPRIIPRFNATVDWFDIRLRGSIEEIGGQAILNTCLITGDPLFCSRIHRDSNGTLWQTPQGFVDDTNANIGALQVRGVDFGAAYSHALGPLGSANFAFNGTWLERYVVDNGGLAKPYRCDGRFGTVCGTPLPHWRHLARVTWQPRRELSLSLNWRHIGAVTSDGLSSNPELNRPIDRTAARIDAQDYVDFATLVTLQSRYVLRLGIRNIFDREPPILPAGEAGNCSDTCNGNTYPQLYDPLGRNIFAGFTVSL